jgi:hypothetical protein
MVRWIELDKINMHNIYITYIFSMTIRPHDCGSWHIIKPKKNERIILCPLIKSSPFSYGNGYVPKLRVYYAFIVHKIQKNTFFEWIFKQNL